MTKELLTEREVEKLVETGLGDIFVFHSESLPLIEKNYKNQHDIDLDFEKSDLQSLRNQKDKFEHSRNYYHFRTYYIMKILSTFFNMEDILLVKSEGGDYIVLKNQKSIVLYDVTISSINNDYDNRTYFDYDVEDMIKRITNTMETHSDLNNDINIQVVSPCN